MKVEAMLCSCSEMKMKRKPIKRPVGCYNGRRKSSGISTRKGHSGVPRGGWLGAVRKKLHLKTNKKDIIIIHNNTSIVSNDDDIRASSSVDPPKELHLIPAQLQLHDGKPEDLVILNPKADVVVPAADPPSPSPAPAPAVAAAAAAIIKEGVENYSLSLNKSNDITSTDDDQQEMHKPLISDVAPVVDENKLTLPDKVALYKKDDATSIDVTKDDAVDQKEMAAVRIQTAFRSHLARRAFRALKSLVRLQAVVRGVVVRRQARMALHCMRALIRLGDRVRNRQLLTSSVHDC